MASTFTTRAAPDVDKPRKNASGLRRWGVVAWLCLLLFAVASCGFFYWRPVTVADGIVRLRLRMAGFDSRYVQVGPYRVHYFVGGTGKPLLLIHGLGGRAEDWAPEMPAYTKHGFRVYAIDLLGCGRTSRPDIAYSMQQQADMVNGFLDALHVQQADVAGWSMGGWVAMMLTLAHPERVRRLVLMDSAGLLFKAKVGPSIFEPKTRAQLARLWDMLTPKARPIPSFVGRDALRWMERNAWVTHRTVKAMLQGHDLLDGRLGQIHVPVLIVWGAQDALIPPSSGEQMHREMLQSVLELYQGCGHLAPATCAERIVPRVRTFLDSAPPMAGGTYRY
ncbi:MAG: alpha/beta fold hydrolase [Acidobacteriaceae bacterium]